MDKMKDLYAQYLDKAITWYSGLEFLEQMGVLFVVFVVGFGLIAYVMIRRAAG